MRRMTTDKEKTNRRSFENAWWTIERKRKSLIEKAISKKGEAIAIAKKIRQAAIKKSELDYKEAIASK